jgi:hypothetical protein
MHKFDIILLLGRPAAGKSEIIDFILKLPDNERRKEFYMAKIDEIDDFPMLWTWYEEDDILTDKLNKPKLHITEDGYFKETYLWDLLIERINLDYDKHIRDIPDYNSDYTSLIEFSRGSEHGGYKRAFQHLSDEILKRSVILYVNVSFEESLRKNRQRFDPDRPDSILHHSLTDEKLSKLYREIDWEDFRRSDQEFITVRGIKIPYVIFENEDDVTTNGGKQLESRLKASVEKLIKITLKNKL